MKPLTRPAKAVLERYREQESLGEAGRARTLAAIESRIEMGDMPEAPLDSMPPPPEPVTTGLLAKVVGAPLSKVILGLVVAAVPAAWGLSRLGGGDEDASRGEPTEAAEASRAEPGARTERAADEAPAEAVPAEEAPAEETSAEETSAAKAKESKSVASAPPKSEPSAPGAASGEPAAGGGAVSPAERASHASASTGPGPSSPPSDDAEGRAAPTPANDHAGRAPAKAASVPADSRTAKARDETTATAAPPTRADDTSERAEARPAEVPTIDEEVALLGKAHAALRAGNPGQALTTLAEHARRFPNSKLADAREAARILALCAAGRRAEAKSAAKRFLRARPGSPMANRIRSACLDSD